MKIKKLTLKKDELPSELFPRLLGNVFHFTTSRSWNNIQSCAYVDTNQTGKYRTTSVHSQQSLGHHLDAVCMFDLRGKEETVFRKDWILFDYFNRRWTTEPSYFLILAPQHLSSIKTLRDIDETLKQDKMYIPEVESWHLGKLPLERVELIYQVQIIQN